MKDKMPPQWSRDGKTSFSEKIEYTCGFQNDQYDHNHQDCYAYTDDPVQSPEVYLKVMDVLGLDAEECLIFEDSLIGTEAAKASGAEVAVIHDRYSDDERDQINSLADYIIDDYYQACRMLMK